jgi:dipeptidase E
VPTAAGPDFATKDWVQADIRQLEVLRCEVSTLDLAVAGEDEIDGALAVADGVLLVGGNAYLLLWHVQRSGFAERVVPLVQSGELLYMGTSAGALLAGPDIEPAAAPNNRAAVPALEATRALGLVDFSILPHDQEPARALRHDAIVAAHPEREFVRLKDDQAVAVLGDRLELVTAPMVT